MKNCPFLILYGKYDMSSCTTFLIRNSDTPISLSIIDLIFWDHCHLRLGSHKRNREFFFFFSERSMWRLSCRIFVITMGLIQPSCCSFQCECQAVQQEDSKNLDGLIASWCCFPHSYQLSKFVSAVAYCTPKCMLEIIFKDISPISLIY